MVPDETLTDGELPDDLGVRLRVLEMTIAAIAARLPKNDLQEVVSMLVFVAKGPETASALANPPEEVPLLESAGHWATVMLDRISRSRASDRAG